MDAETRARLSPEQRDILEQLHGAVATMDELRLERDAALDLANQAMASRDEAIAALERALEALKGHAKAASLSVLRGGG